MFTAKRAVRVCYAGSTRIEIYRQCCVCISPCVGSIKRRLSAQLMCPCGLCCSSDYYTAAAALNNDAKSEKAAKRCRLFAVSTVLKKIGIHENCLLCST